MPVDGCGGDVHELEDVEAVRGEVRQGENRVRGADGPVRGTGFRQDDHLYGGRDPGGKSRWGREVRVRFL